MVGLGTAKVPVGLLNWPDVCLPSTAGLAWTTLHTHILSLTRTPPAPSRKALPTAWSTLPENPTPTQPAVCIGKTLSALCLSFPGCRTGTTPAPSGCHEHWMREHMAAPGTQPALDALPRQQRSRWTEPESEFRPPGTPLHTGLVWDCRACLV